MQVRGKEYLRSDETRSVNWKLYDYIRATQRNIEIARLNLIWVGK